MDDVYCQPEMAVQHARPQVGHPEGRGTEGLVREVRGGLPAFTRRQLREAQTDSPVQGSQWVVHPGVEVEAKLGAGAFLRGELQA